MDEIWRFVFVNRELSFFHDSSTNKFSILAQFDRKMVMYLVHNWALLCNNLFIFYKVHLISM